MKRQWLTRCLPGTVLAIALAAAVGCGTEQARLVPAEGIVTINGKPAPNIMVQFLPDVRSGAKGPTSTATTDQEGKFWLTAQDGREGAVPGTHMVVLVDFEEERTPQGQMPRKKPRLDTKYAAPMTSRLTAEVREGGGPIAIDVIGP